MNSKPKMPIEPIKQLVKTYKSQGFDQLTHHQLALALTTIGFKEVCKEFGGQWTEANEKEAFNKLKSSEYQLGWYGKVNNPNYVPFLQMCSRGDLEKIKEFIVTLGSSGKKELLQITDNFKRSPLHLAVKQGYDVVSEYLIKEGFSPKARDRELKTPLHYCSNELVCQLLLKKGASPLTKDNKNCTAAHYAAGRNDCRVLQLLLSKANVVNETDHYLKTPIFYAIYSGSDQQISILRTLVENGAKIDQQDSHGKTPLHYAAQLGRTRCIPFLLQKGASPHATDNHRKTPLDLASNEKVRKIMLAYAEARGHVEEDEAKQKRAEFSRIGASNTKQNKSVTKEGFNKGSSSDGDSSRVNQQIYTRQINQVATWVREKFFVLMKKLQESGIKAQWHLKRPYIYTASWAEDIDGLEQLFECLIGTSGPQAAMRTFNILCPYQKQLPNVTGRSEEAFQGFFGEKWFSNDPVEKVRNMHSQSKIRNELQAKAQEVEGLKSQLLGYQSEIQKLEGTIMGLKSQLSHYQQVEQNLRKERAKNTQQYSEILSHINEKAELKAQLEQLSSGEDKNQILTKMADQLRSKNDDLHKEIENMKVREAASRRKCGQLFLKSLSLAQSGEAVATGEEGNLYDDDAIINLYDLLRDNPPNLEKRFQKADRRGTGKLNIEEFTKMLEQLSMLPQDVMSMHRITGFAQGRKTLSLEQFKTLLQNRHKSRPMWEKKLIRKMKSIILAQKISLDQFFSIVDTDQSGTIEAAELRKGLQNYNIFMNQSDWSNLFNLLDADKSGTIELSQMKNLFAQEATGKLSALQSVKQIKADKQQEAQEQKQEPQEEQKEQENKQEQQGQERQKDEEEEPQAEEPQKQEEQERQPSQRSDNKLLSEEEFKEEYQEEDSQAGLLKLNGEIKVQVPKLQVESQDNKVFLKLAIGEQEYTKMADLNKPKLSIAIKFSMIEYLLENAEDLNMSLFVWEGRENLDEENYLGETLVQLESILDKPNQWGINSQFDLEAGEFEKEVDGSVVVQVKWIPKEEDE